MFFFLTDDADEKTQRDFLGEAHMLAQFQHNNVMGLFGAVTVTKPVLIVIHYMPNGDLRKYLIKYVISLLTSFMLHVV